MYFLALMIESLIEREVRNNMVKEDRKSIQIYPESRPCVTDNGQGTGRFLTCTVELDRGGRKDREEIPAGTDTEAGRSAEAGWRSFELISAGLECGSGRLRNSRITI